MIYKKSSTKTFKAKVVPFNKKNMLKLADKIYSDKNGVISVLKLCYGDVIKDSKDGKRTAHCAVGEAYHSFISPLPNRAALEKACEVSDCNEPLSKSEYTSKYSISEGETAVVIDALVEAAHLKNPEYIHALAYALDEAVEENDGNDNEDTEGYIFRAERVATVFREKIAPLLK
jgi:hypothetical protein